MPFFSVRTQVSFSLSGVILVPSEHRSAVLFAHMLCCLTVSIRYQIFFSECCFFLREPAFTLKLQSLIDRVTPDVVPHQLCSDSSYRATQHELWLQPFGKQLIHNGWHASTDASTTRRIVTGRLSSFAASQSHFTMETTHPCMSADGAKGKYVSMR